MSVAVLLFQILILATIGIGGTTRPRALAICIGWTLFTLAAVFTAPLMLLQLVVIWGGFIAFNRTSDAKRADRTTPVRDPDAARIERQKRIAALMSQTAALDVPDIRKRPALDGQSGAGSAQPPTPRASLRSASVVPPEAAAPRKQELPAPSGSSASGANASRSGDGVEKALVDAMAAAATVGILEAIVHERAVLDRALIEASGKAPPDAPEDPAPTSSAIQRDVTPPPAAPPSFLMSSEQVAGPHAEEISRHIGYLKGLREGFVKRTFDELRADPRLKDAFWQALHASGEAFIHDELLAAAPTDLHPPAPAQRQSGTRDRAYGGTARIDLRRGTDVPQVEGRSRIDDEPDCSIAGEHSVTSGSHIGTRNSGSWFSLLLFDLDGTLVDSGSLEKFRGNAFVGPQPVQYLRGLAAAARSVKPLSNDRDMAALKARFPGLKMGVVTRAPRAYARCLLATLYPTTRWDAVVAFEDVNGEVKPDPSGIELAKRLAGVVTDDGREAGLVALVGDDANDVCAAYQAGAVAILVTAAWDRNWKSRGNPARSQCYRALSMHPDAIVPSLGSLSELLEVPWRGLLAVERAEDAAGNLLGYGERVDEIKVFRPHVGADGRREFETVHVLGRYFPSRHDPRRPDLRARAVRNLTSRTVLDAKDGRPYPRQWADAVARFVQGHVAHMLEGTSKGQIILTPVPAHPGRPARMEQFVAQVTERIGLSDRILACPDLLAFDLSAESNKRLDLHQRFENVRKHLSVKRPEVARGAHVLVIDDVVTSGATLFWASRHLRAADARSVVGLALTRTVS